MAVSRHIISSSTVIACSVLLTIRVCHPKAAEPVSAKTPINANKLFFIIFPFLVTPKLHAKADSFKRTGAFQATCSNSSIISFSLWMEHRASTQNMALLLYFQLFIKTKIIPFTGDDKIPMLASICRKRNTKLCRIFRLI